MIETSSLNTCRQRTGFSLIETAIVLGVVGLVVGGIWVAAANVREKMLINDLVAATLQIQTKVNYSVPREALWPAANTALPAQAMGLFSDSWTRVNDNSALTPLGQSADVKVIAGTARIVVTFWAGSVSQQQCINFSRSLLNAATSDDVNVGWRPSGTTLNKTSGSLANITSMCVPYAGGNYQYGAFYFTWGQ